MNLGIVYFLLFVKPVNKNSHFG